MEEQTPQPEQSPPDDPVEPQPWDQQPDEPNFWYDRFVRAYLAMGSSRSAMGAYHRFNRSKEQGYTGRGNSSWLTNAKKWKWEERAAAYDAAERREFLANWRDRQQELISDHRKAELELSILLIEKAKELLAKPNAKFTFHEIARLIDVASRVGRKALNMEDADAAIKFRLVGGSGDAAPGGPAQELAALEKLVERLATGAKPDDPSANTASA